MIDIELEVFTFVAKEVRKTYPQIHIVGERLFSPPKFPCASVMEQSNVPLQNTQSSDCAENHSVVMYEVNIFSNKKTGKKAECRAIASVVDKAFDSLGFVRILLQPIDNREDATIYRIVGRYQAVVSKNKVIYRR